MYVKDKVVRSVHLEVEDKALLYVAMNAGSPTGRFRDSAGYAMLQQRTYAAQLAAAREMDEQLIERQKQRG